MHTNKLTIESIADYIAKSKKGYTILSVSNNAGCTVTRGNDEVAAQIVGIDVGTVIPKINCILGESTQKVVVAIPKMDVKVYFKEKVFDETCISYVINPYEIEDSYSFSDYSNSFEDVEGYLESLIIYSVKRSIYESILNVITYKNISKEQNEGQYYIDLRESVLKIRFDCFLENMKLFIVTYFTWNGTFSNLIKHESLSVGVSTSDAIDRVKESVPKDARDFSAVEINSVMGFNILVSK